MNAWYTTLQRPPLTPPNWLFSPVWTVLYVMILASIVLYYRAAGKRRPAATLLLLLHLATNFAWTFLFFRLRSPALALTDILVLDLSLVLLIRTFWRTCPQAALLLLPYLLWVFFATYLNSGFWILN